MIRKEPPEVLVEPHIHLVSIISLYETGWETHEEEPQKWELREIMRKNRTSWGVKKN